MNNTVLALDLLIRWTEYTMKLQQVLAKAQAEGRDITEDELTAIRIRNMDKMDELINR